MNRNILVRYVVYYIHLLLPVIPPFCILINWCYIKILFLYILEILHIPGCKLKVVYKYLEVGYTKPTFHFGNFACGTGRFHACPPSWKRGPTRLFNSRPRRYLPELQIALVVSCTYHPIRLKQLTDLQ